MMQPGNEGEGNSGAAGLPADTRQWLERLRAAHHTPPAGALGPYVDLVEVGRGGEGVVFRARHRDSGRCVALKRLAGGLLAGPQARARFERGVRAAARLRHPAIVRPLDLEVIDGLPVLVMEWIEGTSLDRWLDLRPAPPHAREAAAVVAAVCDAVGHAHRAGVAHRDLKPSNVLVDGDGKVHVLDFGLAKHLQDDALLTGSSEVIGTLAYAPPERVLGTRAGTGDALREDVFSLGAMLHERLYGEPPFGRVHDLAGYLAALGRGRKERPPRIAGVDAALARLVARATAHDPDVRHACADELAGELRAWLGGEPLPRQRASRWLPRPGQRRAAVALGGALLCAAAVLMARNRAGLPQSGPTLTLAQAVDRVRSKMAATGRALTSDAAIARMLLNSDGARPEAALGQWLFEYGSYEEACVHLEAELAHRRGELRDGDPRLRAPLFALAMAERGRGHPAAAQALLEEALALRGGDGAERSRLLSQLAEVCAERALFEPARQHAAAALAAAPPGGADRVHAHLAAAIVDRQLQRPQDALDHVAQAERAAAGDALLLALTDMARCASLGHLGRFEDARDAASRSLRARQRTLGDEHPYTQAARANLAAALVELGQFDQAEQVLQLTGSGAEFRSRAVAMEHCEARTARALIHRMRGELDAAVRVLREGLESARSHLGPGSEAAVNLTMVLAEILLEGGRLAEGEHLMQDVLDAVLTTYGADHPLAAYVWNGLGGVARRRGDDEAAAEHFARATAIMEALFPAGHPRLVILYLNLSNATRDSLERQRLRRQALAVADAVLPEAHMDRVDALLAVGADRLYSGRPEEAGPYLAEGVQLAAGGVRTGSKALGTGLVRLARCHEQLGDRVLAIQLGREAVAAMAAGVGPDSLETLRTTLTLGQILAAAGAPVEAGILIAGAASRLEAAHGARNECTLLAWATLAQFHYDAGSFAEARGWACTARDAFADVLGPGDSSAAKAALLAALAALELGDRAQGLAELDGLLSITRSWPQALAPLRAAIEGAVRDARAAAGAGERDPFTDLQRSG